MKRFFLAFAGFALGLWGVLVSHRIHLGHDANTYENWGQVGLILAVGALLFCMGMFPDQLRGAMGIAQSLFGKFWGDEQRVLIRVGRRLPARRNEILQLIVDLAAEEIDAGKGGGQ